MTTVIIVIHLMVVLAMIGLVLLQRSEGGALGIGGGEGAFMTGRGAGNVLTRATGVLAVAFLRHLASAWRFSRKLESRPVRHPRTAAGPAGAGRRSRRARAAGSGERAGDARRICSTPARRQPAARRRRRPRAATTTPPAAGGAAPATGDAGADDRPPAPGEIPPLPRRDRPTAPQTPPAPAQ